MTESEAKRYFTPKEANETLSGLLVHVDALLTLVTQARQVNAMREQSEGHERDVATDQLDQLREKIQVHLGEIQSEGVELKGVDPPLLDFPALRYGQEVYLCWKQGEDAVSWWHPMHTGIAGRQDLATEDAGWWEWCN